MLSSTSGIYTAWGMTSQWRYTWPRCDSLRIASHIPRIVYWSALRPALSHSGTVSTVFPVGTSRGTSSATCYRIPREDTIHGASRIFSHLLIWVLV